VSTKGLYASDVSNLKTLNLSASGDLLGRISLPIEDLQHSCPLLGALLPLFPSYTHPPLPHAVSRSFSATVYACMYCMHRAAAAQWTRRDVWLESGPAPTRQICSP
jgi:hypothetical protein